MEGKNCCFLSVMYMDDYLVFSSRKTCIYLDSCNEGGVTGQVRSVCISSRGFMAVDAEGFTAARFVPASMQSEYWMLYTSERKWFGIPFDCSKQDQSVSLSVSPSLLCQFLAVALGNGVAVCVLGGGIGFEN